MASLSVIEGPEKGKSFDLGRANLVMIGRDPSCTFQILDPKLSRMHLQIKALGESRGHAVIDFQSANGVFVNGSRIAAEHPLAAGDMIRIGDTAIIYYAADEPTFAPGDEVMRRNVQGAVSTQLGE